MFQFLTIIDQFSCFCSQYYGILSRGEKKLDFLFYLVLQVHQHITIQYTSRPFHIVISPSPLEPNLQKKEKYYILISGKEWLIFFRLRHLPYYFHLRKNFGDDITSSAWEKMDLHKWQGTRTLHLQSYFNCVILVIKNCTEMKLELLLALNIKSLF